MAATERTDPAHAHAARAPRPGERPRRRPPAALVTLLAAVLAVTATWSLVVPAWQSPDEPPHFSYVQTIGEHGRLPGGEGLALSTRLSRASAIVNAVQVLYNPTAKPEWTRTRAEAFARAEPGASADDGGGPNASSTYPPLYYAAEALPYLAVKGAGTFTQLYVLRLFSALFVLVTVTGAWLLAGELFGPRRLIQVPAAATAGLWPMMTMVTGSVNPDGLLVALWTLALWMGVKVIRHGLTLRRGVALGGLVGAAFLTKVSAIALAPAVVLLLVVAAVRAARSGRGRAAVALVAALAAMAVPVAAYTAAGNASGRSTYQQASEVSGNTAAADGGFQVREFASYLWQFYLPRLPSMQPIDHQFEVFSDKPVLNLWLATGSGVFGWVNVWFPSWVYWTVGAVLLLVAALFAAASARWWRSTTGGRDRLRRLAPAAFLATVALVTLAALHYTDYTFYAADRGTFMHGRYLLPLAGVLAAVVGWALHAIPRRHRALAAGVWLGALAAFQIASLALVLGRWYA